MKFFLVHEEARRRAAEAVQSAPHGYEVQVKEPSRNLDQNSRIHAMVADIARQCRFMDSKLSREDWKRLLIDAFARIKAIEGEPLKGYGRILPSLDGSGFVQLGVQSRDFRKSEASEFIEYLFAWGADHDPPVEWSEPPALDEEYIQRYG